MWPLKGPIKAHSLMPRPPCCGALAVVCPLSGAVVLTFFVRLCRASPLYIGNENSARSFFWTEVFGSPLGSWTSAPSGHGCPGPSACFSSIWGALTEVLGRDISANDPRMSAGYPSQKLPLWADFSFLSYSVVCPLWCAPSREPRNIYYHHPEIGCTRRGVVLCERACFCLLSAFYDKPPSKNPSKNVCLY